MEMRFFFLFAKLFEPTTVRDLAISLLCLQEAWH